MRRVQRMIIMAMGCLLPLLSACEATEPYVFKKDEFDRESPTFNVEPVDRYAVVVCYNGLLSSRDDVAAVAAAECGRYGKEARWEAARFGECPLLVATEGHFDCVRP